MTFLIELRHILTGLSKSFSSKQEVADFLAQRNETDWSGWERLGTLPEPTPIITTGSPMVPPVVDPVKVMTAQEQAAVEAALAEPPVMADADPDHGEEDLNLLPKADPVAGAAATLVNPLIPDTLTGSTLVTEPAAAEQTGL